MHFVRSWYQIYDNPELAAKGYWYYKTNAYVVRKGRIFSNPTNLYTYRPLHKKARLFIFFSLLLAISLMLIFGNIVRRGFGLHNPNALYSLAVLLVYVLAVEIFITKKTYNPHWEMTKEQLRAWRRLRRNQKS